MILGYRDKRTLVFAAGKFVREFQGFDRQAWKRLEILDAATSLDELRALPSNRVEALQGDRDGQYSVRIKSSGGLVLNGLKVQQGRRTWKSQTITRRQIAWHVPPSIPAKYSPMNCRKSV